MTNTTLETVKFDLRYLVLFRENRYAVLGTSFESQEIADKLIARIVKDGNLGKPLVRIPIDDATFKYLARATCEMADKVKFDNSCIAFMNTSAYRQSENADVPEVNHD